MSLNLLFSKLELNTPRTLKIFPSLFLQGVPIASRWKDASGIRLMIASISGWFLS